MISPPDSPAGDYLPARMLNEYVYCTRLFFYEHVEGIFVHNAETVEGAYQHRRVDAREDGLPAAEELVESETPARFRSVMLSSDRWGVIAKMDLLEGHGPCVVPVDYKRGRPRKGPDGVLEAWDPDRIQLAAQALVLRENGYRCEEAIVYYAATRQRVRVVVDEALIAETVKAVQEARRLAASGRIPLPLIDSPKCPRCSLVGVCLPDETNRCAATTAPVQRLLFDIDPLRDATVTNGDMDMLPGPQDGRLRRLVSPRDDLRPLYLNTQGLYVGKSGQVLKIKEKERLVQEVRLNEICQLCLFGSVQLTTQAIQALCEAEVPIAYFSYGGWFYGVTQGLGVKNIYLRREQFRMADIPAFCLRLARALVAGKIRNQRTMLQRNHLEPPASALVQMKCMQQDAERADGFGELLGIEGNAARVYFQNFAGMLKGGGDPWSEGEESGAGERRKVGDWLRFDFQGRNRRPPRDPVNALLSLAYSVLAKDLTIVAQAAGLDPYLGYYHQPRFGRASLALDLMEPFRPLVAESAVLSAINTRMVTPGDFVQTGRGVALTADGRKKFFRAYEQRMDVLVTHPIFGYRISYRRLLDVQTRLLARVLTGELLTYPVFTTR